MKGSTRKSASVFDPLCYGVELPYQAVLYPLGFRMDLTTNSQGVIQAAEEDWSGFPLLFDDRTLEVRVAVSNDDQARTLSHQPDLESAAPLVGARVRPAQLRRLRHRKRILLLLDCASRCSQPRLFPVFLSEDSCAGSPLAHAPHTDSCSLCGAERPSRAAVRCLGCRQNLPSLRLRTPRVDIYYRRSQLTGAELERASGPGQSASHAFSRYSCRHLP